MPFYIFAWIAVLSFGLFNIVGKLTAKHTISNPWLFSFAWTFTTLILTVPIALINNVGITSLIAAVPASIIFAFMFSIFAPQLLEKHTLKVYAIRFTAATIMIAAALKLTN